MSTGETGGIQAVAAMDTSQIDAGLERLKAAIRDSEGAMATLKAGLDNGSLSVLEYASKIKVLESEHKSLERAARSLEMQQKATAASFSLSANAAQSAAATQRGAASSSPTANSVASTYDIVGDENTYSVESAHRATAANDMAADSYRRLITDVNEAATANQRYTVSANAAATATGAASVAVAGTSPRTQAATRAITDFSRAAEDFSTGGFLGVMNNIPGVMTNAGTAIGISATKLALWTSGVSIAVAAGYLLYKNWDSITAAFEERNPFPKTTDSIEGMTEAIKTNEKALDELRKKESLNNDELERANRLLKENTELEAKREAAKNAKKFREAPSEQTEGESKGFEEAFKGMGEKVGDALEAAFKAENAERAKNELDQLPRLLEKARKTDRDIANRPNDFRLQEMRAQQKANWDAVTAQRKLAESFKNINAKEQADRAISDIMEKRPGALDRARNLLSRSNDPNAGSIIGRLNESDPALQAKNSVAIADELNKRRLGTLDDELKKSLDDFKNAGKDADRNPRMEKPSLDEIDRQRKATANATEQQNKELDREALKAANRAAPGIDREAKDAILEGRAAGNDPDTVARLIGAEVANALKARGVEGDLAERAGKQISEKAAEDVQEDIIKRRLKMEDALPTRNKPSEVFGITELSNKIQAGVGSDEKADRKKLLNLNEQMLNALARQIPRAIEKAKAGVPNLRVK